MVMENHRTEQQASITLRDIFGRIETEWTKLVEEIMREARRTGVLQDLVDGVHFRVCRMESEDGIWVIDFLSGNRPRVSRREREVGSLLLAGHPRKMIATQLQISARTVDDYVARLCLKFHVHSRAGLIQRLTFLGEPSTSSSLTALEPLD